MNGEYIIPYLHPLAVHFPIALLLTAAGTSLLYLLLGRGFWRKTTFFLLLLGTVGAFVAQRSGEAMEEEVEGEPMAELFLEDHEEMAERTVLVSLVATLLVGALSIQQWLRGTRPERPEPLWARTVVFLLALACGVLVAYTGHLGGLMVWGVPAG